MTTTTERNLEYEQLTVVEQLIIETLTARWRLGENAWTFSNRVTRQLGRLEARGWIGYKSGIVERTYLVWFTSAGRAAAVDPNYTPPPPRRY